jgi:peptidoglycan biosynthesis protein MviN/MurJ (putative lipid II flippase)
MMVNAALRTALLAVGGEGAYARGVTLAALLGVGLNMAVTPWWGASGSALASLGAETALCAAAAVGLRRRRIAGVPGPYWGRLTLVSLIALAFLWGVKTVSPDAALGLTVLAALAGVVTTLTRRLRGLLPGALPPPGG